MGSARSIAEAVQIISGTHLADKLYFLDCEVKSVDEAGRVCTVIALSGKVGSEFTARLMASIDDGILAVPVVGSTVVVSLSDFTTGCVVQYSELDNITLRGGDLGGMVKVIELTKKINNLENKLNALITKYNTHTHNVTAIGSPTGPGLQPETGTLTPTQRADIENTKITHG
jgi:hypothetical protein